MPPESCIYLISTEILCCETCSMYDVSYKLKLYLSSHDWTCSFLPAALNCKEA